jgi:quinol monooxygenase YgiN
MIKFALFARFEARPGKEADVATFLEQGLHMVHDQKDTPVWFALKLDGSVFGVFDAFASEEGRQAHLNGLIVQAMMAKSDELFAAPPRIELINVLGLKNQTVTSVLLS